MRSALVSRLDISVLPPLLLLALTVVAPGQEATPGAAGLRAVHVGNSHSHPLRLLDALAPMVGHKDQKNGHINILGAPLRWNWDHGEQNKWPQTLAPTNAWDAITLLSWADDDAAYAPRFAGDALKGNPRCQVYVYVIWPDANMDFEKPPAIRSEEHGEAAAAAVAKVFPDAPKPRVIPASLLIRELGRLADRGELPHVTTRFELFTDGGHLSQYGQYALTTLVCAMLYQESPLAYPADIYRADTNGKPIRGPYQGVTVPPDTADAIKRAVWDIMLTYPLSGMRPGLIIADRRLVPVIAGQPYKAELKALSTDGECAWSLAKGRLPNGLSLSPDGVLAGQSGAAGDYPITLKVTDGKASFERPVMLTVTRRGTPEWTEEDFHGLLDTIGCAGYGWLKPEGVRRELEKMTREWQGPPPLPGEKG